MARPAYSQLLLESPGVATGTQESEIVPDGFVWVVRDVYVSNETNAHWGLMAWQLTDSAGTVIFEVPLLMALPGRQYHREMRQVLEAGDQLLVSCAELWSWRISGYVLTA